MMTKGERREGCKEQGELVKREEVNREEEKGVSREVKGTNGGCEGKSEEVKGGEQSEKSGKEIGTVGGDGEKLKIKIKTKIVVRSSKFRRFPSFLGL